MGSGKPLVVGCEPLLLRPSEVAGSLAISRSKAYALLAQGVIPTIRIGRSIRIPVASLKAWIEAQTK